MEQRQLAWLITTRSQVRVLVPQPRKSDHFGGRFFLVALLGKHVYSIRQHGKSNSTYSQAVKAITLL